MSDFRAYDNCKSLKKGNKIMYNSYNNYPCSNFMNSPWYPYPNHNPYYYNNPQAYPYDTSNYYSTPNSWYYPSDNGFIELMDYGPNPFTINIDEATKQNNNFRTALWTGDHLQLTLMSLNVGEDIGLEMHPDIDQFIRIEEGQGVVMMGDTQDDLNFQENVYDDFIFIIPAGKWHNLINTGNTPLKLYSIYAPVQHPHGTVHETKDIAMESEEHH